VAIVLATRVQRRNVFTMVYALLAALGLEFGG
jgi:hypothetical protein